MIRSFATWTGAVLGLAAINYVAGRFGLLLAIPPGFASVVFPPSGIVLAAILLLGYRVWPGGFLGSFAFNIHQALHTSPDAALASSAPVAASIALGSSVQAIAGAALIRRFVGFPTPLLHDRDIIRFLTYGGPVSCLIAATWGVTTLLFADLITWVEYMYSWWTWWVGDTISVLIFTPLILIWAGQPREIWRQRKASVAGPLCLALTVAIAAFVYASGRETARIQAEFERRATSLAQKLERDLSTYVEILNSIGQFFLSSREISRSEFRTFVEPSLARYPGIHALQWIPRVTEAQRRGWEAAARRDGLPAYEFTQRGPHAEIVAAARRDEYFPVYYIEPRQGNERALGFDLASDPTRLAALRQALSSGQPTATAPTSLVQESGQRAAVLVFVPVLPAKAGAPDQFSRTSAAQRGGFASGVFRIGEIVEASLATNRIRSVELRLLDATGAPPLSLYGGAANGTNDHSDATSRKFAEKMQLVYPIYFAGRLWSVELTPTQEYLAAQRSLQAWLVLASGLLFTSLLGAFLLSLAGRAAIEAERSVELAEANLRLEETNRELERFAYAASHDLKAPLRGIDNLATFITEDTAGVLSDETRSDLQRMRRLIRRLERLLDDLLEYARVGRLKQQLRHVNTQSLVTEIVELLLPPEGFKVEIGNLPDLHTDRAPLEQVFRNLIDNAIKHRDRPDGRVHVSARDTGKYIEFAVRDDGPGIPAEYQEQVFQMFRTLRPRDQVEGSGMGLALVKKIVETRGGSIHLESEAGKGATFRFLWPK